MSYCIAMNMWHDRLTKLQESTLHANFGALAILNASEEKERVLGAQNSCVVLVEVHLPCLQFSVGAWDSQ